MSSLNKTIIHVYGLNGVGDFIRGSIYLMELFNNRINVKLNLTNHVISNYIKHDDSLFDYAEVDDSKIKFRYFMPFNENNKTRFDEILNEFSISDEPTLYISTNFSHFHDKLDYSIKNKIMPFFNFTDDVIEKTKSLISKYEKYELLDVRMKDTELFDVVVPKNKEERILASLSHLKGKENIIVTSNSNYIKNKICEHYNFIDLNLNKFCSSVKRLDKVKDSEAFLNNVVKINLLKNASRIYSYNEYPWDSGIPNNISLIFDIPKEKIQNSNPIIENTCSIDFDEIVSATYGKNSTEIDVTEIVKSNLNTGSFKVTNEFLRHDPAPGKKKALTINYLKNGVLYNVTVSEFVEIKKNNCNQKRAKND